VNLLNIVYCALGADVHVPDQGGQDVGLLAIFYGGVGVLIAIIWIYQFVQLMLLSDPDFPGKYDKILWVVAFCVAIPVAPFAFLWWKSTYRSMLQEQGAISDEQT